MKHLLIDLAINGYTVVFTDSGFAMKESIEIRLIKTHPGTNVKWHQTRVLPPMEADAFLEEILRDMRDELNMSMGIA